jgi:hypothetical protein
MNLTLDYTSEKTGATFTNAYVCLQQVSMFARRQEPRYSIAHFGVWASKAAHDNGDRAVDEIILRIDPKPSAFRPTKILVSSSSEEDTSDGDGAQTVTITGNNGDSLVTEVVTLNGTSIVPTTNDFTEFISYSVTTTGSEGSPIGSIGLQAQSIGAAPFSAKLPPKQMGYTPLYFEDVFGATVIGDNVDGLKASDMFCSMAYEALKTQHRGATDFSQASSG